MPYHIEPWGNAWHNAERRAQMRIKKVRAFKTASGAKRYLAKMIAQYPQHLFQIMPHPSEFRLAVAMWAGDRWAYCN